MELTSLRITSLTEAPMSPSSSDESIIYPLRQTITFAAYVTLNDGRRDICHLTPNRMPRTNIDYHPTLNRHKNPKALPSTRRTVVEIWEVDITNPKALRAHLVTPAFRLRGLKYRTYLGGEFVFDPDTSLPGRPPIDIAGDTKYPAPEGGFETKLIEEKMIQFTETSLIKMRVFHDFDRMIGAVEEDLEYLEAINSGEAFSSDEDIANISLRIEKNIKKCNGLIQIPPKYTTEATDKILEEIKELGWRYIQSESVRCHLLDSEKMLHDRFRDMVDSYKKLKANKF